MAFQKAVKARAKLRAALFGPSGAGKTWTALAVASGMGDKIALIDSERGSASKYADRFDFDTVDLEKKSVEEYVSFIKEAAKAGYEVLIIDSLTHAWQTLNEEVEKIADARYKGNFWAAWSEGTPLQRKLIDALISYPGHIIATMRSKTEWQTGGGEGNKSRPIRVGLAPEQGKGIEYEFDILFEITPEHLATIIKDRTGKFQDRILEKPGKAFGEELVAWLNEGAALPPPAKTREQLEEEYKDTKTELKNIMDSAGPDGKHIFTDAEYEAVRGALAELKGKSAQEHLDTINRILAEKKSQLKDRLSVPPAPASTAAPSRQPAPAATANSAPPAPPPAAAEPAGKDKPQSLSEEFKKRQREKAAMAAQASAPPPELPAMYSESESEGDDGFEDDLPEGFTEAGEESVPAELDIF